MSIRTRGRPQRLCGRARGYWRSRRLEMPADSGCPTRMEFGPCGGVRPDGRCEMLPDPCVFDDVVPWSGHRPAPPRRTAWRAHRVAGVRRTRGCTAKLSGRQSLSDAKRIARAAGRGITSRRAAARHRALPPIDDTWNARLDTVDSVLDDRRGHMEAWQLAERRSSMIGDLLEDGTLSGELLVLRHARAIRRQRVSREPPQDP